MKVNVEEVSQLERRLKVELSPATVNAAFDKMYQSIQRDATIKGFRKGKAPLTAIKSMYKEKVKSDVINQLVQEHYVKAIDDHSLDPVNYPNIQVSELEEERPFSFSAEFEIRPEVKMQQYDGLVVEKEIFSLDPKHIDSIVENIRTSHASRENVLEDRPSQKGDVLVIDFDGEQNGQPVPNTHAVDFDLELGSNSFIPGFEDGLLGAKVGQERSLDLKFPVDYHAKDLAGAAITFKVKVKALKKSVLPEVSDELAKRVGFDSVAKMHEALEADYRTSEEKRIAEDFKKRILKALVARNPVDVPKSMLNEQKQMMMEDVKGRMKQQGMAEADFKEYADKWDADFNDSAAFMIQSSFLLNAIAQKEGLAANSEDLNAKIEEYAQQTGIEPAKLKGFYNEGENRSRLLYKVTEDKVVEFLKSKAKIREVKKEDLKDKD